MRAGCASAALLSVFHPCGSVAQQLSLDMPPSRRVTSLVRNIAGKKRMDRELTEEVGAYVELLTEKKMKEGMNETEARRAAMVEVGGVEQVKEEVRASRTGFALEI